MAKAKSQNKTLQVGDVATFVVAVPHCGLEAGEERTMKVTPELLACLEKGYWKKAK